MKIHSAKISFLALLLAFSFSSFAKAPLLEGPQKNLPSLSPDQELRVTVWNIYKGERGIRFEKEFTQLSKDSDLMLLQEVLLNEKQKTLLTTQPDSLWVMAQAWKQNGIPTGAAAVSSFRLTSPLALLSRDGQPITNTPKSSVLFELPINGQESLLVVNTHAINFTFNGPFRRQMEALGSFIREHQGPVLWAGDFNTWNGFRRKILLKIATQSGMREITFKKEPRHLILDHAFVRGLQVTGAWVLDTYQGSDHWPLYLVLKL